MDGRPGGTRTPSPRFWRPVLYQLSYWPTTINFRLPRLSMGCMRPTPPTEFLNLKAIRHRPFVLGRAVVTPFALLARQRNNVAH